MQFLPQSTGNQVNNPISLEMWGPASHALEWIPAYAGMTSKRVGQEEFDGGVRVPRCLSRLSFLRMQESIRQVLD